MKLRSAWWHGGRTSTSARRRKYGLGPLEEAVLASVAARLYES